MEERRQEDGRMLKAGKFSQAEIARQLGVSRATVSDWAKVVESQGIKGLKSKKARGVEAKLSQEQKQRLKKNSGPVTIPNISADSCDNWGSAHKSQCLRQSNKKKTGAGLVGKRLDKDKKVAAARRKSRIWG